MTIHKSVLVDEVVSLLNPQPKGTYLDVTFGSGGHTRALLEANDTLKVIGFDWDKKSLETFALPFEEEYGGRFYAIWANFAHLYKVLKKEKIGKVQGILADFGTSQMQIHDRDGFSFQHDTPLDMRMSLGHYPVSAADIVNTASEFELAKIFWDYSQERHSRAIARAIVHARRIKKITTTAQLVSVITKVVRCDKSTKIHPATRVFQALRIVVNHELDNIKAFLAAAIDALDDGGRLVCISFHSLEDSLVKECFAEKERAGLGTVLTKKVVTASEDEMRRNSSSRSAKVRAFMRSK